MFHANMDAFYKSLVVMVVATPFMFLTMALFWLLAAGLSRLPDMKKDDK
ncbi:MAG: hypothetical protein K0R39_1171 [Symbiobacteriaceae bacterium]|jgi:hypothetical protein|nr:hypothetical protein [Symbiobacteriaceae bacterium]